MKNNRRLGLGLFYFILNWPPLIRDVTCSRYYLDRKNVMRKCQMNNLIVVIRHSFQKKNMLITNYQCEGCIFLEEGVHTLSTKLNIKVTTGPHYD